MRPTYQQTNQPTSKQADLMIGDPRQVQQTMPSEKTPSQIKFGPREQNELVERAKRLVTKHANANQSK